MLHGEVFGAMFVPVIMGNKITRNKLSQKYNEQAPEVSRAVAFTGLFTRVAESESLSVGHVVQVAKGRRKSRRVTEAIIREVRRIERSSGRAA